MINVDLTPREALEQFFGFDKFKGEQESIIQKRAGWTEHLRDHAYRAVAKASATSCLPS
jgi:hypothetical protein